jgi:hypothetical protein
MSMCDRQRYGGRDGWRALEDLPQLIESRPGRPGRKPQAEGQDNVGVNLSSAQCRGFPWRWKLTTSLMPTFANFNRFTGSVLGRASPEAESPEPGGLSEGHPVRLGHPIDALGILPNRARKDA